MLKQKFMLVLQAILIIVVAAAFAMCFALVAAASWADDRMEEMSRRSNEKSPVNPGHDYD